jgi:hypothetical protein
MLYLRHAVVLPKVFVPYAVISYLMSKNKIANALSSKLEFNRGGVHLFRIPEQSNSALYKERAAICAWCAEQTISAEAGAALRYLEQMYILIAEVVDITEGNKLRSPLGSDRQHLSPE